MNGKKQPNSVRSKLLTLLENEGKLTHVQIYGLLPGVNHESIRGRLSNLIEEKEVVKEIENGITLFLINPDLCPLCYEPRDNGKQHGSWCK